MKFGELFVDKKVKNQASLYAQWCLVNEENFDEKRYLELVDAFIAGVAWERLSKEVKCDDK